MTQEGIDSESIEMFFKGKQTVPASGAGRRSRRGNDDNLVMCYYNDRIFYVPNEVFSTVLLGAKRMSNKKYVRYKEGAELYSMSERKFTELANNADAVMHVDKIALVNIERLDQFIEFNNR